MGIPANDIPGLGPTHDFVDEHTEEAVYELAQCLDIDPFELAKQLNIKLPRFRDKLFAMAFARTPENRKPRVLEITPDEWLEALSLPEVRTLTEESLPYGVVGKICNITLQIKREYL